MTELSLPPLGHIGRFLDELFPAVEGIDEYEGSVHIRSTDQQEFAGITLRVTGDQLTSLPMVAPPPEGADWDQLSFPHVGDGVQGGLRIATSTILFNTTAETVTGAVEFFNSDGTAMDLSLAEASASRTAGETPASRFEFTIEPKGVERLSTAGEGEIKVGSALVNMDQPISGTALFTLFDQSGRVATEVGVNSARLRRNFTLIADTTDVFNTGIAITNPIKSEESPAARTATVQTATVRIDLRDGLRRLLGTTEVEVGSLEHTALFLTELFPEVEGVEELQGLLRISSSDPVAALSLRAASEKLTSVPIFTPKHGFAPNLTLEFAQDLAGTAPSVRWLLHQNNSDLSLQRVVISAPLLGLNTDAIVPGTPMMFGYLARTSNSRVFQFIPRDTEDENRIEFDLVTVRSTGTFIQASGSMEGSPSSGLVIDLLFAEKAPNTFTGNSSDLNFFLPPDLINLPDSPQSRLITAEYTSVSTTTKREQRILRRTAQEVTTVAPHPENANLESVSPLFLQSGSLLTLRGSNLGDTPTVRFPVENGVSERVAFVDHDGLMKAFVPPRVVTGDVQLDSGSGFGNLYRATTLFSPTFTLQQLTEEEGGGIGFRFVQAGEQFLLTGFTVNLYNLELDLTSLEAETTVGSGEMTQGASSEFQLIVNSSDADQAVLNLVEDGDSEPTAQLIVQPFSDFNEGFRFTYVPAELEEEPILMEPFRRLEWVLNFTDLPIESGPVGAVVGAVATMLSSPTGADGAASVLSVEESSAFQTE